MKPHFEPRVHWNPEYQLLQPNLKAPMESQGDILENTGLLLAYWGLHEPDKFYKKVVSGLEMLKFSKGFGLTKYLGPVEPKDSKPGRWHTDQQWDWYDSKDKELVFPLRKITDPNPIWYRQDVSHSQAWYIIFGLHMIYEKTGSVKAMDLLVWYSNLIRQNGYKVGTTSKGDFLGFPPLGNHLLKAWAVSSYAADVLPSARCLWSVRLLSLWTCIAEILAKIGLVKYGPTDVNNTGFHLYGLYQMGLNDRFKKWNASKKATANLDWLQERYEKNKPDNSDVIQDDLKYLNRVAMLKEMV